MKLLTKLLQLIYPPRCAFCGKVTANGEEICTSCEKELPYIPLEEQLRPLPGINGCCSPLSYQDTVRESLHRYKFKGKNAYFRTYGKLVAKCVDENHVSCDIISCVPLSKKRLRKRGYNQSELIARKMAELLQLTYRPVLKKVRNNPAQSGTAGKKQRRENVQGVYEIHPAADIAGKSILLVDDIVTTGATLQECARVLTEHGAAQVWAATLARTEKQE